MTPRREIAAQAALMVATGIAIAAAIVAAALSSPGPSMQRTDTATDCPVNP
jgi:hypothetical protein